MNHFLTVDDLYRMRMHVLQASQLCDEAMRPIVEKMGALLSNLELLSKDNMRLMADIQAYQIEIEALNDIASELRKQNDMLRRAALVDRRINQAEQSP